MSSEAIFSQSPPPADARISYGPDPNQFCELRSPAGRGLHPVAMVIHGGFWRAKYDLVHTGHLCAALTQGGIATINIEYRRVGNSGGGWPESFRDIQSATLASVLEKKYPLRLSRSIVLGHSAGGQLALALASHNPEIRGVVALAPVSDLRRASDLHLSNDAIVEFLGGKPEEVPANYADASPIEIPISAPQVIIHGIKDGTVPVQMSRSYAERKRKHNENIRLIELDCGHFELIDPTSAAWPTVLQAVLDLLKA
jgi:acetyl esterase/lipase